MIKKSFFFSEFSIALLHSDAESDKKPKTKIFPIWLVKTVDLSELVVIFLFLDCKSNEVTNGHKTILIFLYFLSIIMGYNFFNFIFCVHLLKCESLIIYDSRNFFSIKEEHAFILKESVCFSFMLTKFWRSLLFSRAKRIFIQCLSCIDSTVKTVGLGYFCRKTKNQAQEASKNGQIDHHGARP